MVGLHFAIATILIFSLPSYPSSQLFDRTPKSTNHPPCHTLTQARTKPFQSSVTRRFKPVGSEASLERSQKSEGTWMASRGWGAYRVEGLYRESVAADGDGDLPEAVQEQHLAAVLHGLFGACSRGYLFLSRCWCAACAFGGERLRGEEHGKISCFSGWIFVFEELWGLGPCWWLWNVACGPWTFSGY